VAEIIGNKVARVFSDLVLGENGCYADNKGRTDKPERNSTDDLKQRVQPF